MKSVAIIGGGITGLTAAFRLRQRDIPVTLYEAGARVGGVIQTIRSGGYLAEFGPNTILETSPRIAALIQDLGLGKRRIYSNPDAGNRYIVRRGKPVAVPGSALAFLTTPLFSASAKLRLLAEPFIRRAADGCEENLAEFVIRRMGREFLDYAVNPLAAGIYAGDPARLSVQYAFPKLHAAEQKYGSLILGQIFGARQRKRRGEVSKKDAKKFSFDEGLQVLIDALEARLAGAVRLCSPVGCLRRLSRGWEVSLPMEGREETRQHSAVLLALPAHKLARLQLQACGSLSLAPLARIHHPPVASVVLGFRRDQVAHPLNGYGMLIPQREGHKILGTIFSSSLFPNRAPAGHVTLTSYVGGVRAPHLALLDAETLKALVCNDLRSILGVAGEPVFGHHQRFPRAIPQYEVGYGRFQKWMNEAEARVPGLFFAGHYRDGISLGDSIVSGDGAAEKIEKFLASGWFHEVERESAEFAVETAG